MANVIACDAMLTAPPAARLVDGRCLRSEKPRPPGGKLHNLQRLRLTLRKVRANIRRSRRDARGIGEANERKVKSAGRLAPHRSHMSCCIAAAPVCAGCGDQETVKI